MDPTPTTTNEGAAAPSLDSPPAPPSPARHFHRRTGLIHRESVKYGPAGAAPRQTSAAFAEEEGGAAQRAKPAACGRMRDAELVPTRAPLCVVVGEGYIREGPHRKGPSLVRLFGYFFGVEKVTRGTGAEPTLNPGPGRSPEKKRCGTRRPHTGYHLFRAAAEASSWAMRERSFSAWSRWFWTMWAGALEVKASLLSLASMPFR